jgi:hypothetical protein
MNPNGDLNMLIANHRRRSNTKSCVANIHTINRQRFTQGSEA